MALNRRQQIALAICQYGLRQAPSRLSSWEVQQTGEWVDKIIATQHGIPTQQIVEAIRHGMPRVWPFSEDGRAFDAKDVYKNLSKAKGAAAVMRQAGRIPMTATEAAERFKRMVADTEAHDDEQ